MNLIVISNVIYLILNIILIFYSITIIIDYRSPKLEKDAEFEKYFIDDLQINDTCPLNYVEKTFGIYEGSNAGCYCNSNNSLYNNECTYEQKYKLNCSDVKKIKSMMIKNYEGKQFCIKREKQYSYYLQNNFLSIGNCPNNYYNCGIIDSFNQSLCLPNANECPINKIVIDQNNTSENDTTYKLNNGKYIHISNNETNSKIIYDFALTDIDYKCQYPDKNIIKYHYDLENKLICEMKDDSFKKTIDSMSKKTIYEDNKIYDEIKNLPNYPLDKIENDNVKLLVGELKGYDLNKYSNITTLIKYDTIPSYFVFSFIIILFFLFFIILGFIFLFCRRCINKEDYDDDYTVECQSYNSSEEGEKNCLFCLCLFILGALIIHCLIFRKGANKLKNSTILFLVLDLIIFLSSLIGYIILCYPLNSINQEIISTVFTIYEKDINILKKMTYFYLILVLFCIFFLYIQKFRKSLDKKIPLNTSFNNLISPPPLQINDNNASNPFIYSDNNNNINNYPMSNQYNINTNTNTNTGNMGYTSNTANV